MKKEKQKNNASEFLRKKAEKKLETTSKELSDMSDMDVAKLVHELQIHQIELEMQNEELKNTQVMLDLSNRKYSALYNFAPVGYLTLNKDVVIRNANLTAAEMLGSEREDLIDAKLYSFIPDKEKDSLFIHIRKAFETREKQTSEIKLPGKNSAQVYVQMESIVIDDGLEKEVTCKLVLTDITELKQAQEAIEKTSQENKDLLMELQHRAKNSFAMIYSLIQFSKESTESDDTKSTLDEISSRLMAISKMYDLLYSTGSVKDVRLDEYLNMVTSSLQVFSTNITLKKSFDEITIKVKTAISLGLLVTELISNSIKYAFPDNRKGSITITLKKTDTTAIIEVMDNGIGLPEGFDLSTIDSLGLTIVNSMVNQINGNIKIEGRNGTRCVVEFPV